MKNNEIADVLVEMLDRVIHTSRPNSWLGLKGAADAFGLDRWEIFSSILRIFGKDEACDYIAANYAAKEICWEVCVPCNIEVPIVDSHCKICGSVYLDIKSMVG